MVSIEMEISLEDCRALYQAVCDALENWPGSPARPAEQQEQFRNLKIFLFSIMCEASLN
jgi:hypothetical protein